MRNQKTNQLNQKASNESAQVNQIDQTNQVIQNSSEPNFNEIQNSHNQNGRNQPNILEGYFQNSQNVVDNGSTRENSDIKKEPQNSSQRTNDHGLDVDFENNRNYIPKEEYFSEVFQRQRREERHLPSPESLNQNKQVANNSNYQYHEQLVLVDKIRINQYKILAVYKSRMNNLVYLVEYTIFYFYLNPDSVNSIFQDFPSVSNYYYNYYRRKLLARNNLSFF
jgi:hypothetical protein